MQACIRRLWGDEVWRAVRAAAEGASAAVRIPFARPSPASSMHMAERLYVALRGGSLPMQADDKVIAACCARVIGWSEADVVDLCSSEQASSAFATF